MTRLAFPPSKPVHQSLARALAEGVALSTFYGMTLSPADVARVLARAKVRYVLVGARAINLYTGRPRATQDVNVVTAAPAKARRAVQQAYPHLTVEDHPAVVRFKDGGHEVLNLIKASLGKLFAQVLRRVTNVDIGGVSVVVPTFEAAMAMKFYAMTSPARPVDDRLQDAVDFSRAAKSCDRMDRPLLHEFGELVYPGGGDALLKLLADARAGRRLDVSRAPGTPTFHPIGSGPGGTTAKKWHSGVATIPRRTRSGSRRTGDAADGFEEEFRVVRSKDSNALSKLAKPVAAPLRQDLEVHGNRQ